MTSLQNDRMQNFNLKTGFSCDPSRYSGSSLTGVIVDFLPAINEQDPCSRRKSECRLKDLDASNASIHTRGRLAKWFTTGVLHAHRITGRKLPPPSLTNQSQEDPEESSPYGLYERSESTAGRQSIPSMSPGRRQRIQAR